MELFLLHLNFLSLSHQRPRRHSKASFADLCSVAQTVSALALMIRQFPCSNLEWTTYVYWVHPVISSPGTVPRLLTRLLAQPAGNAVRAVAVPFALRLRAGLSGRHLSAFFHLHGRRTGH